MKRNNQLKKQVKLVANDHKRKGLDGETSFFVNILFTVCQLVITSQKNLLQRTHGLSPLIKQTDILAGI